MSVSVLTYISTVANLFLDRFGACRCRLRVHERQEEQTGRNKRMPWKPACAQELRADLAALEQLVDVAWDIFLLFVVQER